MSVFFLVLNALLKLSPLAAFASLFDTASANRLPLVPLAVVTVFALAWIFVAFVRVRQIAAVLGYGHAPGRMLLRAAEVVDRATLAPVIAFALAAVSFLIVAFFHSCESTACLVERFADGKFGWADTIVLFFSALFVIEWLGVFATRFYRAVLRDVSDGDPDDAFGLVCMTIGLVIFGLIFWAVFRLFS